MRTDPGKPERHLWSFLRTSQTNFKFRRQAVIGPFIVDFLCPYNGLVIEIDDDMHDLERDQERDAQLASVGYCVMRFSNSDVMTNIEGVLEVIIKRAENLPERRWSTHPNPSLGREGLKS